MGHLHIFRVNHVTTLKNSSKMFKMDVTDTEKSHIGSDYIAHTDPKIYIITVEPLAYHIHCKTTGKILGYRDSVKMDAPVWNIYICNKLGCLSQGWIEHAGNDTIKLISTKTKRRTEGQHM